MKNVQPGMNVEKQRRKLFQLLVEAPPHGEAAYIVCLLEQFDKAVAEGQPRPASEFIPMYHEEFGVGED